MLLCAAELHVEKLPFPMIGLNKIYFIYIYIYNNALTTEVLGHGTSKITYIRTAMIDLFA